MVPGRRTPISLIRNIVRKAVVSLEACCTVCLVSRRNRIKSFKKVLGGLIFFFSRADVVVVLCANSAPCS